MTTQTTEQQQANENISNLLIYRPRADKVAKQIKELINNNLNKEELQVQPYG